MSDKMYEANDPEWSVILSELRSLRKGSGLSPWKVRRATTLRSVIAAQMSLDVSEISPAQVYEYLIDVLTKLGDSVEARATRNAFALGTTSDQSLMKRRQDFSKSLGRHADTVEIYENHGIDELANRLVSVEGVIEAKTITPKGRVHTPAMDTARSMITQGMAELYALGPRASEVHKFFDRQVMPYLDANVEWLLRRSSKGSDWYEYALRYTFRTKKDLYRIGIVTSVHDCEILMASGIVDDVIKLVGENIDLQEETERITTSCQFIVHDSEHGTRLPLHFQLLPSTERETLLKPMWQSNHGSINIIEVQIPYSSDESTIYEYSQTFDVCVSEHYAYWYSPGLMYLNNITIDFSDFPNREKWKFYVQPFLGPVFPGALGYDTHRYSVAARNWIMQGHGFALMWQEAERSSESADLLTEKQN